MVSPWQPFAFYAVASTQVHNAVGRTNGQSILIDLRPSPALYSPILGDDHLLLGATCAGCGEVRGRNGVIDQLIKSTAR